MKGLVPLFLGIFGTFAFSWVGLTVIPNWQIGHLNPQMEEDGTDVYPQPQSGMVERGARVYAANGCNYCHSQQVRAEYAAADIERKWGDRRSAPRDYIFERSVFLGKMRMGQDLANIGARAPAEQENAPAPPAGGAAPAGSPGQQPAVAPLSSPARSGASPNPPPKSAGSPAPNALPAVAGSPPEAPDRRRRLLLHQRRKRQRLRFPTHRLVRPQRPRRQMQSLEGRPPCRPGRRRVANPQFTQSPGSIGIFIRRAALTSIRTCRRIVFFIKRAKSVMRLRSMLYSLPAPTLRPRVGRSFPLLMRNVSSPI